MELEKLGPFSPCSVKDVNGKIIPANKDEIYTCCKNRCDTYLEKCDSYCEKNYPDERNKNSGINSLDTQPNIYPNLYPNIKENVTECKQSCKIMTDTCNKICETSRFDYEHRYFDDCLEKSNCVVNSVLSDNCLRGNQKKIMECCLEKCKEINEEGVDCEKHCKNSWDIHFARSMNKPDIQPKKIRNKGMFLMLYFFVVIFIIIYIYSLISRKGK